ncbi:hypothetical protein diail_5441 [Diaporthe ilicicola]|nr:hypothetical protein diail_5441 [Diaporthe ilicicola]
MCIIGRWIRNWREQRQLLEERKRREAERRIQRENQDCEHARALHLTLCELQRTMDPLVAAQSYNNRFCPLTRLPEELLLHILDFLRGDEVTLCCLRITSRTFLRLLHCGSVFWNKHIIFGSPVFLELHLRLQLRRLLQRDGRCERCMRWNNANVCFCDPCKFKHSLLRERAIIWGSKYWHDNNGKLYCSACDSDHDICEFPHAYRPRLWMQDPGERRCLGQQGSVQLCEHVQIAWASIKAHIDDWRRQQQQQERGGVGQGGDWQACLDSFNVECHDPSHDMRCAASEAPTWPRARLGTIRNFLGPDPNIVVLDLEWTPHGRLDTLAPTADGRIPASELRALFRRFRRLGPADMLYPPSRPDALPEMACFTPSFPIYYETGEEEEEDSRKTPLPSSSASLSPPPSNQCQLSHYCRDLRRGREIGKRSQTIDIRPHYLSHAVGTGIASQCVVVSYKRNIMIGPTTALMDPAVKLIPSHHWLHAMDARTYPHQQAWAFRPQCMDESCVNYYRRMKDYDICW